MILARNVKEEKGKISLDCWIVPKNPDVDFPSFSVSFDKNSGIVISENTKNEDEKIWMNRIVRSLFREIKISGIVPDRWWYSMC